MKKEIEVKMFDKNVKAFEMLMLSVKLPTGEDYQFFYSKTK